MAGGKLFEQEFRTYHLSPELRAKVKTRRKALGMTLEDFIKTAVDAELKGLVHAMHRELPNLSRPNDQPVRLPLSKELLASLQKAGNETGLPVSRLLQVCLWKSAGRKRRRKG